MTKRINLIFDALMQKQNIIQPRDYTRVHTCMEEYQKLRAWQGRSGGIDADEVKHWMSGKLDQKNPEALTDCVRVALGHLLLSSLTEGFAFENEYELMKRAFQAYLNSDYHNYELENTQLHCTA